jgi:hypothetical protein
MKYPGIVYVSYLKGHDLLLEFDNGEQRIIDLSDIFSKEVNKHFRELTKFVDFNFDDDSIWWGDRYTPTTPEIGADSLYHFSTPLVEANSSILSKSMALIDHITRPFDAYMTVLEHEYENYPHVHVEYNGGKYQIRLSDGAIIKPANVPDGVQNLLRPWVIKHRVEAIRAWNKYYPNMQADPATGLLI